MPTVSALDVADLNISFNGVQILHNANFRLERGEIHGVAGKNGAGKSTLMKIFTGVYHADSGRIAVFGETMPKYSSQAAMRAGIAMVYQDLSLIDTLTVAQNIFLSCHPYHKYGLLDDKAAEQEAAALLSGLGVDSIDPLDRVEILSIGQRQLVEIAKALAGKPKILILDEPTASLADAEVEVLFRSLRALAHQAISIVYITHYLEDIIEICDRVTILRDGRTVTTTDISQVSIKDMVEAMLGPEERLQGQIWKRHVLSEEPPVPLVELRDVTAARIHGINLKLYPGEIVGLAGLLGSGRTEILRLLYGLDKIEAGQLLINGEVMRLKSTREAISRGISLLPEERRNQGLVLDFSIERNLLLSIVRRIRAFLLLDDRKGASLTDKFISYLQIKAVDRTQKVRFLSGGNQQKVVIGKCLAAESKILLLDDPTFGVDIHSKAEIMKIREGVRRTRQWSHLCLVGIRRNSKIL